MRQRPTVLTAFGIINIAFGAMGVLCTPIGLVMTLFAPVGKNPVLQAMHDSPIYRTWTIGASIAGTLASVVLLAAGIGLLQMKPWARKASIGYAIYAIIAGIIGWVVMLQMLVPLVRQSGQSPEMAQAIGGMAGGLIGGCIGLVYPIVLLIFMTRSNVKAALESAPA